MKSKDGVERRQEEACCSKPALSPTNCFSSSDRPVFFFVCLNWGKGEAGVQGARIHGTPSSIMGRAWLDEINVCIFTM